jgi:Mg-chelatase subunit ChlI
MNFGWGPDSYAVPYGNPDVKTAYLSTPLGASNGNPRYVLQSSVAMMSSRLRTINSSSFADVMSAFTIQDPAGYKLDLGSTIVDPMTDRRDLTNTRRRPRRRRTPPTRKRNNPPSPLRSKPTPRQSPQFPKSQHQHNQQQQPHNPSNHPSHRKKKTSPARKEQSRSRQMPTTPTQAIREHPSQRRAAEREECAAEVLRSGVARGA